MKTLWKPAAFLMLMSVICLGISLFFRGMAKSTMDASEDYYARMFRIRDLFLWTGIGLAAAGSLLYAFYLFS